MIAWGPGSFENEEGTDWVDELLDTEDLDSIILALQSVVEFAGTEELEPQDCVCAVVACEVVACANGHPSPEIPKRLAKFVREQNVGVSPNVLKLARKAIENVKQTPAMLRHFKESGSLDAWLDVLEDLESRLA